MLYSAGLWSGTSLDPEKSTALQYSPTSVTVRPQWYIPLLNRPNQCRVCAKLTQLLCFVRKGSLYKISICCAM